MVTSRGGTTKLCVSLPESLVAEVRAAAAAGEVSSFVAEALRFYLAVHRQQMALKQSFGVWKDESHPDLKTPEDTVRYVREVRASYRKDPKE